MISYSIIQLLINQTVSQGTYILVKDLPVITLSSGFDYRYKFVGFTSKPFSGTIEVNTMNDSLLYNVQQQSIPINVLTTGPFVIPMTVQHERFVNKLDITLRLNQLPTEQYTVSMDLTITQL